MNSAYFCYSKEIECNLDVCIVDPPSGVDAHSRSGTRPVLLVG
jgi:hypothetical protein